MEKLPLVSVIIPTYNSSKTLKLCLESILCQSYPKIETIIVDNYSVDQTLKIAQKHFTKIFRIKSSLSKARNIGSSKADGVFIMFLDSDMEMTPNVVEECVFKSINMNADAIMIPETRVGNGFWAECRALERLTYIGDPLIESARFFKLESLEKVNGCDEKLMAGEDWDLQARMEQSGCKMASISSPIKHHEGHLTMRNIVLKKYYWGKTLMLYVKKHPDKAFVQFMPIRLNYIRNFRILLRNPRLCVGLFFMKFIEYTVSALAIVSST